MQLPPAHSCLHTLLAGCQQAGWPPDTFSGCSHPSQRWSLTVSNRHVRRRGRTAALLRCCEHRLQGLSGRSSFCVTGWQVDAPGCSTIHISTACCRDFGNLAGFDEITHVPQSLVIPWNTSINWQHAASLCIGSVCCTRTTGGIWSLLGLLRVVARTRQAHLWWHNVAQGLLAGRRGRGAWSGQRPQTRRRRPFLA